MAGIYIPGMGFPEDEQICIITKDGIAMLVGPGVTKLRATQAVYVHGHGRLIDKDVMCNECRRIAEEYDGIYPDCTYCTAHLAPTIIPAEEDE